MFTDFITVPVITLICWFIGYCVNTMAPKASKYIPIICGGSGAVLGIAIYLTAGQLIVATDPYTAIAIGIVSGFAATGIDQIAKQLKKA